MLAYITSLLPHVFYKQPTCIAHEIKGKWKLLEEAHTSTLYNLITLGVPIIGDVLVMHYKNTEFVRLIIDTIGLDRYNRELSRFISSIYSSNENLNTILDIINILISYTDITKLDITTNDNLFLGHLFKLSIESFDNDQYMSDDALQWFLSIYNPETLYRLVSHNMTYVSKEVLQQLLDITVRDYEYLGNMVITEFVSTCVCKHCDMRKTYDLLPLVERTLGCIVRYSINGELPLSNSIGYIQIRSCSDDIWSTEIGKAFFTAYVSEDMKEKLRIYLPNSVYNKYLYELLK